jgi:hypothetical protein
MQTGEFIWKDGGQHQRIKTENPPNIKAPIRSVLDDFTFEFLEGGIPHQRGRLPPIFHNLAKLLVLY